MQQPHLPDDISRLLEELEQYPYTRYAHDSSNQPPPYDETPPP